MKMGLRALVFLAVIGLTLALTPEQLEQHLNNGDYEDTFLYDLQVPDDEWDGSFGDEDVVGDWSDYLSDATGEAGAGLEPHFDEFLETMSGVDDLDWDALEKDLSSNDLDTPSGSEKLKKVLDKIKPMSLDEEDDVTATVKKAEAEADASKATAQGNKHRAAEIKQLTEDSQTEMIEEKKDELAKEEAQARTAEAKARAAEAEAKAAEAKAKLEAKKASLDEKTAESEEGSEEKKSDSGPRVIHHFSPPPDVPPPPSSNYDKWSPPGEFTQASPAQHKSDLSGPVNPPPIPTYQGAGGLGNNLLPPQLGAGGSLGTPEEAGFNPPKATAGYSLEPPAPGPRDFPEFSPTVAASLTGGIPALNELPTPQSVEAAAGAVTMGLPMPQLDEQQEQYQPQLRGI